MGKSGRKIVVAVIAVAVVAAALAAWCTWPLSDEARQKARAVVESRSCAVLTVDGRPLVYIGSMDSDGTIGMFSLHPDSSSCSADSARGYWVRRYALLPSFSGRVTVRLKPDLSGMPKVSIRNLYDFVDNQRERLDSISKILDYQQRELHYYLRSHSVIDFGYDRIANYAALVDRRRDSIASLKTALGKVTEKSKLRMRIVTRYYVHGDSARLIPCSLHRIYVNGDKLLDVEEIPEGTSLRMTVFQGRYWLKRLTPFAKQAPKNVVKGKDGYYVGELDSIGLPAGVGRYYSNDGTYFEGFWKAGERNGFGFSVKTRRPMRVGEWKNDSYRGEKLVYTSDRIYGIDISKHQHMKGRHRYSIDFSRLRITHLGSKSHKQIAGTVDFPVFYIYIKSTEGTTIFNPYYRSDYAAARRNGFHVGSYHFFSVRSTATKQAQFFLRRSHFGKGDFPPVLDLEPLPSQIRRMGGVGKLFARVRRWLRIVENATHQKPVLYVSQQFVNRYLPSAPDIMHDYPIWIARYGEYKPNVKLVFWQLAPDGRVKGIHGEVDINVFNGYKGAFEDFKKHNVIK